MTYGIGNPDPGLMKAQNVAGLTQWMGIKPWEVLIVFNFCLIP
jgi:hypothetical protein